MSHIKTENLYVGYNKKIIAGDISFSISKGEILTIIGPNGCGKSTLLKTVASQLEPLSGSVYLSGKSKIDITEKELAQKMSVMLTGRLKAELMTCRDVVETGRYPYTGVLGLLTENDNKIVNKALETVNAQELADIYFSQLSDGQKQRIMLARAIAQEPEILILDEPTNFLDIKYKLELLTMLKKLSSENEISIIMTLHELELAKKVSDKVLCIKNGKPDKLGAPDEVFTSKYICSLFDISSDSYELWYK